MAALPCLEGYLRLLPRGFDSYPEAQAKGAALRYLVDAAGIDADELPPVLARYVREPLRVDSWVPEVHLNAFVQAQYDLRFAGSTGVEGFEAWTRAVNERLLGARLYRILFLVVSPERLVAGVGKRWSAFRRGSELRVDASNKSSAHARLVYPARLHTHLTIRSIALAFRVAVELAGGRGIECRLGEVGEDATEFDLAWE